MQRKPRIRKSLQRSMAQGRNPPLLQFNKTSHTGTKMRNPVNFQLRSEI